MTDIVDDVLKNVQQIQEDERILQVSVEESRRNRLYHSYGSGQCKTVGCMQRCYNNSDLCYYCGKVKDGLCDRTEYYVEEGR